MATVQVVCISSRLITVRLPSFHVLLMQHAYMRPLGVISMLISVDEERGPCLFKVNSIPASGWYDAAVDLLVVGVIQLTCPTSCSSGQGHMRPPVHYALEPSMSATAVGNMTITSCNEVGS